MGAGEDSRRTAAPLEAAVGTDAWPNCPSQWTIVRYQPPEAMTLDGDGVGGVKVKLIGKVEPADRHVAAALRPPRGTVLDGTTAAVLWWAL